MHQDCGDDALSPVELGFQHHAGGLAIRVGPVLPQVGDEQDHLEQCVDAHALLGRDLARDRVAAVLLDHHVVLRKLLLDPLGFSVGLVDLVDGDDHRYTRRLGVIDGLDGLRLHAVVGGDHQDHDVRDPGAASAHHRERLVARRVEEGDGSIAVHHLICADVLGDAPGLARGDVGGADRVQQRGLAMIDVTHHGDHRRSLRQLVGPIHLHVVEHFFPAGLVRHILLGFFLEGDDLGFRAELLGYSLGHLRIQRLVDRGQDALGDQLGDHVLGLAVQLLGEFFDRHRLGEGHVRGNRRQIFGFGDGRCDVTLAVLLPSRSTGSGTAAGAGSSSRRERPRSGWGRPVRGRRAASGRYGWSGRDRFPERGDRYRAPGRKDPGLALAGEQRSRCRRSRRCGRGGPSRRLGRSRSRCGSLGRLHHRFGRLGGHRQWFLGRDLGVGRRRRFIRRDRRGDLGLFDRGHLIRLARRGRRGRRLVDGRDVVAGLQRGRLGRRDALFFGQTFLRRVDRRGDSLAYEYCGVLVEDTEIGSNVSSHAVEQLDDQSALNLQFFGELIDPQLRHADS